MRRSLVSFAAVVVVAGPALASEVEPLVDTAWLAERLDDPNVIVLDIRNRIDGGSAETFALGHIPGAVHSDYASDGWRAERNGVVGMLPPIEDLERLIGGLGIDNDDHVVVVPAGTSSSDFGSATRVYWTFQVLGHDAVSILDGGFAAWKAAGLDVAQGSDAPAPARFVADFQPHLLATPDDVRAAMASGDAVLIDARPAEQFAGDAAHPRAARPGTLPDAVNLPQASLVAPAGDQAIRGSALDDLLARAGITPATTQIAFCNTGHWASIAWFASSELAGHPDVRLFDASMVGWTADADNPVVTGAAD